MPRLRRPSRMCGTAAAASSRSTVMRTISEPARARAATCAMVPSISAVSVLVIDCTTIGAPAPAATLPTMTFVVLCRALGPAMSFCSFSSGGFSGLFMASRISGFGDIHQGGGSGNVGLTHVWHFYLRIQCLRDWRRLLRRRVYRVGTCKLKGRQRHQGVTQRRAGDRHQPRKWTAHLQDQENRDGGRERAGAERNQHGCVRKREETEAGEDDGEPEHQRQHKRHRDRAPGLRTENAGL